MRAASCFTAGLMSSSATFAPSAAYRSAIANPMLRAAPVTTQTFFSSFTAMRARVKQSPVSVNQ